MTSDSGHPTATSAAIRSSDGKEWVRVAAILAVNLLLVLAAVLWACAGNVPPLTTQDKPASALEEGAFVPQTLNLHAELLPVSAAMALILTFRRLDLALPATMVLVAAMRGLLPVAGAPAMLAITFAIGAGLGLTNAACTYYGRVSSALWTGVLLLGLLGPWLNPFGDYPLGAWPRHVALAVSLGWLTAGAFLLGVLGLSGCPSNPPDLPAGKRGWAGLACAWVVAEVGAGLAVQSATCYPAGGLLEYPLILSSAAMSGAFILRGRMGALTAVALACVAHLCCALARSFGDVASHAGHPGYGLLTAAWPLMAVVLYVAIDRLIRRYGNEEENWSKEIGVGIR